MTVVAALYVDARGVYSTLDDVELWGVDRDARRYSGPHPVVAHPPCERWGRYWQGGPSALVKREKGDDDGCFAAALAAVRAWGGVLEHPADSSAWRAFGIITPPRSGGWVSAGDWTGWTCCVEQGHYGHEARKATWLYAHGVELPVLQWGPSAPAPSARRGEPRRRARTRGVIERMSRRQRAATPRAFAELLVRVARSARGRVCPLNVER
jgi:hypothetical protein